MHLPHPRPCRDHLPALRRCASALALACMALAPQAQAGPAVSRWTVTDLGAGNTALAINSVGQVSGNASVAGGGTHAFLYSNGTLTDLGTLGGTNSNGVALNDAGQVAGYSNIAGTTAPHAFLYSNGAMTDLGTLGGNFSQAFGINAAGQVVGYASISGNTVQHAFVYSNGAMTDLGTLGGNFSQAFAINAAGQVTGSSQITGNAGAHAFLYGNGTMTDLGTLGGNGSVGFSINAAGQVTGQAFMPGNPPPHAFLYSKGVLTDLGTLGGKSSQGNGINDAGQVTGAAAIAGDAANHAFLFSNGAMTDLNTVNGVAGTGVTLSQGASLNNVGQIAANGTNGAGPSHGYVLTLSTIVWEGGSSGSFSSGSGWSFQTAPNRNAAVAIDPVASTTILGPSARLDVKQLSIGGDATGNNGIATLVLNGGTLNVLGDGGQFTTVGAKGVLTGDGTINGAVNNLGTVNAVNLSLPGGLANSGTVTGNGWLNTSLSNGAGGLVRTEAGQLLRLSGTAHSNSGSVEVRNGGELQVTGGFTNAAGGRVVLNNGVARFTSGLVNNGQVQVTFGGGEVFGAVTTNAGGKVILSGNSNTTFYDAVDVAAGGELRISSGSTVVFFGPVSQRTGSLFTGTGTKFYEGSLAIGASPGLGADAGDVNFGGGNVYTAEIGGTTACTADCATSDALKNTGFDRYIVAGHLALGGTLRLGSWNGFVAQAGQSFDLFDWGSVSGRFGRIDASGLALAAGTALDTSQLYTQGVISVLAVQAVPEPQSWLMWAGGLALMAGARKRRIARFKGLR